ncbi:hypothetical protein Emtol_3012 [Emticicia oligotrophica DSM 17448]|uniref:DUF8202 domain-containing protein n=1 Tax=Emticicia oligotrophica (strain DSM 17448 / CIP 109782 / MTCC 6937 / GPTSA100-15) TaxID=929562 RepID=A0ABN4AP64_EMTOG|nr:hypothetical protein [Emticicia oligotrophica]AFK04145.1 hypothetical protein Emtol_3012 [Emticicia oligotrophica DSM 17448]
MYNKDTFLKLIRKKLLLTLAVFLVFVLNGWAQGGPAGVSSTNLAFWSKVDDGTALSGTVTQWKDNSPKPNPIEVGGTAGTVTKFAPNAAHNFQPYFSNFSDISYFYDVASSINPNTNTGTRDGLNTSYTTFAAVTPFVSATNGGLFGLDDETTLGAEPGFFLGGSVSEFGGNYNVRFFCFSCGATNRGTSAKIKKEGTVLSWTLDHTLNDLKIGLNGLSQQFTVPDIGLVGNKFVIGRNSYGAWSGAAKADIQEIIWFNRTLSTTEVQRVESYLATKYGATLTAHNYINSAGQSYWTLGGDYDNAIFGITRDSEAGLNVKQSTSTAVTGANLLTVGIDNTISTSNAAHTGLIDADKGALMFGWNAQTGLSPLPATGSGCTLSDPNLAITNAIWKVVETGTVESTKLMADIGTITGAFFNPTKAVYMQICADSTFDNAADPTTNPVIKILMVKDPVTGKYVTNYNFNGTVYIRFLVSTAPLGTVCTGDKNYLWYNQGWNTNGTRTRTSTIGDQQFAITVTDPGSVLYSHSPDALNFGYNGLGKHLYLERNNEGASVVTTNILMQKPGTTTSLPANGATFTIYDIDEWYGSDVVKVYGSFSGTPVTPKIATNNPTALSVSGNTITGLRWVDVSLQSAAYITFDQPIDRIWIEWTKTKSGYQDIRISDFKIKCQEPIPPVVHPDNVYVSKAVDVDTSEVDAPFKYTFRIQNDNCTAQTISFSDVLPQTAGTVSWVDGSLSMVGVTGSSNAYGNTSTLSFSTLNVPVGVSYIYASAKGTSPGKINNQASFTVTTAGSLGGTYQSSNASASGDTTDAPTQTWIVKTKVDAKLTVKKTVDIWDLAQTGPSGSPVMTIDSTQQNKKIRYEYTITNPNTVAILTDFTDNLPTTSAGKATFVASSVNNPSGTANAYGGTTSLRITNLNIPASGTVIFRADVNVGTIAVGDTVKNIAHVQVQPSNSSYLALDYPSNATTANPGGVPVNTKIILCTPVAAPTLASTSRKNVCPAQTVDLTAAPAIVSSTCPSGYTLEWHSGSPATPSNLVTATAVPAGTYYAFCKASAQTCYSSPSAPFIVTIDPLPAGPTASITGTKGTSGAPLCAGDSTSLSATCASGQTLAWKNGSLTIGSTNPIYVKPNVTTTYTATCTNITTGCVSDTATAASKIKVFVNLVSGAPGAVTNSTNGATICAGTSVTLNASCTNSGEVPAWFNKETNALIVTGNGATVKPTVTTTYTAKCFNSATGCYTPTTSSVDQTVTVYPVVSAPTGTTSSVSGTTVCDGTVVSLTASCANGSNVVWYNSSSVQVGTGSPLNVTASNSSSVTAVNTYTATCKSITTGLCESSLASAGTTSFNVYPNIAPASNVSTTSGNTTICSGTAINLQAICSSGTTVAWFNKNNGALITTGSPLQVIPMETTTYTARCQSTSNSCYSSAPTSSDVTITVVSQPSSPTGVSSSGGTTICPGATTTIAANCASGTAVSWYINNAFAISGSPILVQPTTTTTYEARCKSSTGTCESVSIVNSNTTISIIVSGPPEPGLGNVTATATTICMNGSSTINATCPSGYTVNLYKDNVFTGISSTTNILSQLVSPTSTSVYQATCVAPVSAGGCQSALSTASSVTVTVQNCVINGNFNPTNSTPGGSSTSGNASTEITPTGGIGPYSYSNGTNDPQCIAPNGALPLPASSNLVVQSNGAYSFTAPTTPGTYYYCIKVCDSSTPTPVCKVAVYTTTVIATNGLLNMKVFLQGPLSGTNMTTILSTPKPQQPGVPILLPTSDPYGKGAIATNTTSVTDWVLVELRNGTNGSNIVESVAALLSSDGTIRNPDGTTPLKFSTTSGNYYVAVRHRNHLGVMTQSPVALSSTAQSIDFTSPSTLVYTPSGSNPRKQMPSGVMAMWAGNATGIYSTNPDKVSYTGLGSDLSALKTEIGSDLSKIVDGYLKGDLNLDGKVNYTSLGTDLSLLKSVLNGVPGNTLGLAYILSQVF